MALLTGSGSGPHADERSARLGAAAAATVAVGSGLVLAQSVLPVDLPCPVLTVTGVPCPACGLTRLAHAVVHGRLGDALSVDPAGVLLLAIVGVVAAVHLLGRAGVGAGRPIPSRAVVAALVVVTALHWGTTLSGGLLPPV